MTATFVTVLADNPGQMQVRRSQRQSEFLLGLAAGTGVGRLALALVQFSAARTPQAQIWRLRAFHQQHLITFVKAIKKRGDLMRQYHRTSKDWKQVRDKSEDETDSPTKHTRFGARV